MRKQHPPRAGLLRSGRRFISIRLRFGRDRSRTFYVPTANSATKTETPLIDLPQSVDVVPRDLFALQGARSMVDALKNIAGVTPWVGDGQRDQVYIRGFSAQNDQYLDGVRDLGDVPAGPVERRQHRGAR